MTQHKLFFKIIKNFETRTLKAAVFSLLLHENANAHLKTGAFCANASSLTLRDEARGNLFHEEMIQYLDILRIRINKQLSYADTYKHATTLFCNKSSSGYDMNITVVFADYVKDLSSGDCSLAKVGSVSCSSE